MNIGLTKSTRKSAAF